MFWVINHGIPYAGMGPRDGEMPDDKICSVVTFLSHLKNLPRDVQAKWRGPQQNK